MWIYRMRDGSQPRCQYDWVFVVLLCWHRLSFLLTIIWSIYVPNDENEKKTVHQESVFCRVMPTCSYSFLLLCNFSEAVVDGTLQNKIEMLRQRMEEKKMEQEHSLKKREIEADMARAHIYHMEKLAKIESLTQKHANRWMTYGSGVESMAKVATEVISLASVSAKWVGTFINTLRKKGKGKWEMNTS